jgi:hypothetical protein
MANFTKNNGPALNGSRTQLLIAGSADVGSFEIKVDGARIQPSNFLELLGVSFNRKLTVKPYALKLAKEARFCEARVARLNHHIPRGWLLRQLGSGLLMGKLGHTLLIVAVPRLQGSTAVASELFARVKIAMNNIARSVVGGKRDDYARKETLLETAQYLSVNKLAVKATRMAAWGAFMSDDG